MVTEPRNIVRFLSALGEPTDVPAELDVGTTFSVVLPFASA
ncbi:hypothetical protein [Sorangium sp. So ce693]